MKGWSGGTRCSIDLYGSRQKQKLWPLPTSYMVLHILCMPSSLVLRHIHWTLRHHMHILQYFHPLGYTSSNILYLLFSCYAVVCKALNKVYSLARGVPSNVLNSKATERDDCRPGNAGGSTPSSTNTTQNMPEPVSSPTVTFSDVATKAISVQPKNLSMKPVWLWVLYYFIKPGTCPPAEWSSCSTNRQLNIPTTAFISTQHSSYKYSTATYWVAVYNYYKTEHFERHLLQYQWCPKTYIQI